MSCQKNLSWSLQTTSSTEHLFSENKTKMVQFFIWGQLSFFFFLINHYVTISCWREPNIDLAVCKRYEVLVHFYLLHTFWVTVNLQFWGCQKFPFYGLRIPAIENSHNAFSYLFSLWAMLRGFNFRNLMSLIHFIDMVSSIKNRFMVVKQLFIAWKSFHLIMKSE